MFTSNTFLFLRIFSICFINKWNWSLIQEGFVNLRLKMQRKTETETDDKNRETRDRERKQNK